MTDPQLVACIGIGLIGLGIANGAAMRWAGQHIRQKLREQANQIYIEYAKDRQYMGRCLRAAGVLPFIEQPESGDSE